MASEPALDALDIQGNIVPGFHRNQQLFVALQADEPKTLKAGLRLLEKHVTCLSTTLSHRAARKLAFRAGQAPPTRDDLWLNIGLGSAALQSLGVNAPHDRDLAFQAGMIPSRTGDCSADTLADGSPNLAHPKHWRVGGPNARIDLLCIFAADADIEAASAPLLAVLRAAGLRVIYQELAALLDNGVEHFGFVDGISQPGPMGTVVVDGAVQPVTTRYGVPTLDGRDYGKPGQMLVDPAQFVFAPHEAPDLRNGSYLVLRRLTQDVVGFYSETDTLAATLTGQLAQPITGDQLRARIVGRWPSGQPLMRAVPDPMVPENQMALNHFRFGVVAPAIVLSDGERISASTADPDPNRGLLCPIWAHIRKVNPRDQPTDKGGPDDTASFQMLRRGIPFGPPYLHETRSAPQNQLERGLMFVAYQTNISTQFETLNHDWMNGRKGPAPGGFDLLVGQNLINGLDGPKSADFNQPAPSPSVIVQTMAQWVTPTGGAYLFAPGLAALHKMAA
ncbi:MAG TPA: hypothetical protein VFW13_00065 [Phenylobacterium sp.]|nr:hypothetical protein [Phenylobacterium sp.]